MSDLKSLLAKCLPKLFACFDKNNDVNAAIGIIDAIQQACVKYPIKEKHKGSLCLLLFDEKHGIIKLLRTIIKIPEPQLKSKIFKFIDDFLDLVGSKAVTYGSLIMDVCIIYIKVDSTAAVKKSATVTLSKVLEICQGATEVANLDIKQLIQELFLQLSIRKVAASVKEEIHCLLGVISHFYPEDFIPYSERILTVYIQELKKEMTSKTTSPNLSIITGCLLGLKEYLYNFTVSYTEDEAKSFQVYKFTKNAIEADIKNRYSVCKAGLQLLAAHASQFAIYLYEDSDQLYSIIDALMSKTNREMQKIALIAVDALLKQVVEVMLQKMEENRSGAIRVFNYFFKDFKEKLSGYASSKQLTIAVKGYGLFAGACKSLSGEGEVQKMFLNISQRSENLFFGQSSNIENMMTQLPSFLESLASIIKELDNVSETMLSSLEKLVIFQVENFPHVPTPYRFLVTQAIIKVFVALQKRGDIFPGFLSRIVYQGIIRTCSHSLILDVESQAAESETNMEMDFVIENPRVKIITYRDYLYLWSTLLNVVQWKELNVLGVPLTVRQTLKEAVYDEIIRSIILVFHKLDLTTKNINNMDKQTVSEVAGDCDDEYFSSDPLFGLQPHNLNDFRIFLNIVDFCREFMETNAVELFDKWVYTFGRETVFFASKYPFNSGFYKLTALNLNICSKIKYFEDSSYDATNFSQGLTGNDVKVERTCSFYLFSKFAKEVVVHSQQFKDDLLASCLHVLLALPTEIVKSEIRDLIPALQNTFKLGLSYLPLAEAGLDTLERWRKEVPPDLMKEIYPDVLPLLNNYLLSSGVQGSKAVQSTTKAKSQKTHKMSVKYVKIPTKTIAAEVMEESKLTTLQHRIITFLGSIGSENNKTMLKHSFENAKAAALAWDSNTRNHLKYPVPFVDMKPEIYFDDFLPRVLELATSSSQRQVKVAACEVLHSLVLYMVGRGSVLPQSLQEKASMEKLFKHILPGLLELSCDVDQVTKQLFHPLVVQLTHWFTHSKTIHTPESQVILLALWDGVTDQQNAALRDFSALCLKEYFTYTLKQSKERRGGEKNFFKRMSSFAVHPNPYKRLGAALVFNNIYTIFRKEEALIQKYTLELLVNFVNSLAIAHNDDKLLGTQKQCIDALDHVERICIVKAHLFKDSHPKCRKPWCLKAADLLSAVEWILCQCGNPQTECRHKCMELVSKLSSSISGLSTTSEFIQLYILTNENSLEEIFEKRLISLGVPPLKTSQASWKTAVNWMEALMASLECYNWALVENIIHSYDKWLCNAVIFKAVGFFLKEVVSQSIDAVISHFSKSSQIPSNCSPKEVLEYNRIKCYTLMRVYTIFEMVHRNSNATFSEKFVRSLWNKKFWEVIVLTVINPGLIGFDVTDYEVSTNLSVEMLKLMRMAKCQEKPFKIFCNGYLSMNKKYDLLHLVPFDLSCDDFDYLLYGQILSGYDTLIQADVWPDGSFSSADKAHFIETIMENLFDKVICKDSLELRKSPLSVPTLNFAKRLLLISSALGMEPEMLSEKLLDTASLSSSDTNIATGKGLMIFNMFENEICEIICKLHHRFIPIIVNHIATNQSTAMTILIKFLSITVSVRDYRKTHGPLVVGSLLNSWQTLESLLERTFDQNTLDSILSIINKMILIDPQVAYNSDGKYPLSLFFTYAKLFKQSNVSLDFKVQLLDLLPYFLNENTLERDIGILKSSLENVMVHHFPISSKELVIGSSQYNHYLSAVKKFLSALKYTGDKMLLELLTLLFCREEKQVMEEEFQKCLSSLIKRSPPSQHLQLAEVPWKLVKDRQFTCNIRMNIMDCVCLTILRNIACSAFVQFYILNISSVMNILNEKLYSFAGDHELVARINSFKLLEILYSRLDKDQLHSVESQVVTAYLGKKPVTGKELTSAVIQFALEFKRENLLSKTAQNDLYRTLYCSSFNAVIAVVSCVQNELKFYYNFIFKENPSKGERIWENIVDCTREYVFNVELDQPLVRQKKFVSIRHHCRETESNENVEENAEEKMVESSLHFMASQNLALSSLADDVSKYDFSTSEKALSMKEDKNAQMQSAISNDPKMEYVEMEVDELNQHECMASLSGLLRRMLKQGLIPTELQTSVPLWLEAIINKLEDASVPCNVKIFLSRLITNNSKVLFPYAKALIKPLMGLIVFGTFGTDLNYNILDIIIAMLSWAPDVIPENNLIHRHEANNVLEFFIKKCAHPRRDIFRNNLEVVKTILECWKDIIEIPYRAVYEMLKVLDPASKVNITGIQLLGVILTCNFPPHSKHETEGEIYLNHLVGNLNNKYQEIFAAASEVIGLILKYRKQDISNLAKDNFFNAVVQQLSKLKDGDRDGKFVTCLYKIHLQCPEVVSRFFPKLMLIQQKLQGIYLNYVLQMLCSSVTTIKNGYHELKSIGLFENIEHKEEEIQHIVLQIIEKVCAELSCDELLKLLPFLITIHSQPAVKCRLVLFNILMALYDKYRFGNGAKEKEIERLCQETLLKALADSDLSLRLMVNNFWSSDNRLPVSTKDRLIALMKNMYSPPTESSFLQSATFLLLERTSHSPDYKRKIFDHPLSECNFLAYQISTSWRQPHAMTPLFVSSISNSFSMSLASMNPTSLAADEQLIKATQLEPGDFSATNDAFFRGKTFNWITEKSVDTFQTFGSLASSSSNTYSPTKSHLFTARSSSVQSLKKSAEQNTKGKREEYDVWRLKRRYLKDRTGDSNMFARREIRRQDMRQELRHEQQKRREAEVSMHRQYRIGELPDIEIPNSAVIAPLQVLAQNDAGIAKLLLKSILVSICDYLKDEPDVYEPFVSEVSRHLCAMLKESIEYVPSVISFCLESLTEIGCTSVDPEVVFSSSLNSNQQSIGILLLESRILSFDITEPKMKKVKSARKPIDESLSQWIRLSGLHKSLMDYDVVNGIFAHIMGNRDLNRKALEFESRGDYSEAVDVYKQLYQNVIDATDKNVTQAEEDFWDTSILFCYDMLTNWEALEHTVLTRFTDPEHPDLQAVWEEPYYRDNYLPFLIRSKVKGLLEGRHDQSLLSFFDKVQKDEEKQSYVQEYFAEELALLHIIQDSNEASVHYTSTCYQKFLKDWKELSPLAVIKHESKLQDLQKYVELKEFLKVMSKGTCNSAEELLQSWKTRNPSFLDSLGNWDDICSNRLLYLKKMQEKRDTPVASQSSLNDSSNMEIESKSVRPCYLTYRVTFQLSYANYSVNQGNIPVALKCLKKIRKDVKNLKGTDELQFIETYCRANHRKALKLKGEEKLKTLLNSCQNLDKFVIIDTMTSSQKLLQSQAFELLAEMLINDEIKLHTISEDCKSKIFEMTGQKTKQKVISSLQSKSFSILKDAVKSFGDKISKDSTLEFKTEAKSAYMTLANFCNERLRQQEMGTTVMGPVSILHDDPRILIETLLSALRYGDSEALQLFPRLLQIIELHPEVLQHFIEHTSNVPCWMFIGWINQMVALLDKPEAEGVQNIIKNIVDEYPNAVIYPFRLSCESYSFPDTSLGKKRKTFVERIKGVLEKDTLIMDFMEALQHLMVPHIIFKDYILKFEMLLSEQDKDDDILALYNEMQKHLFKITDETESRRIPIGPAQEKFAENYLNDIEEICGKRGKMLLNLNSRDDVNEILKSLKLIARKSKEKDDSKYVRASSLKELSSWMVNFQSWKFDRQIEIPGQYTGKSKPLPEYHVKIAGFDEKILILSSLTAPRRITIRGNDEKEYKILAKSGEDLRQDNRLQQLFCLMNEIYAKDPECARCHLKLATYNVVPLSSRFGLIEWVDETIILNDFLHSSLTSEEKKALKEKNSCPEKIFKWMGKHDDVPSLYTAMYTGKNRLQSVKTFEELVENIPKGLLKRAFMRLSSSPEAFLCLRSEFARSHAVICVSQWLLGVGDRHLGNFLVDLTSGQEIGIDFGHAFGSATQFLIIPELVPFRLTSQYLQLMEPLREKGTLETTMIHALSALRRNASLLINVMDIFIKEPTVDWKAHAERQQRNLEITSADVKGDSDWFPKQRVDIALAKLKGYNPCHIMKKELGYGHGNKAVFENMKSVCLGDPEFNIRAQLGETDLTVEEQVSSLIDQATDPHILCKTYMGWCPWM